MTKKRYKRPTFTYEELCKQGKKSITVISNVNNPNDWLWCKYLDGHYWPHSAIN